MAPDDPEIDSPALQGRFRSISRVQGWRTSFPIRGECDLIRSRTLPVATACSQLELDQVLVLRRFAIQPSAAPSRDKLLHNRTAAKLQAQAGENDPPEGAQT